MEIHLPSQIVPSPISDNKTEFTISPCYPGYGTTLGNALRRVLLSSLPGAAITAVKIKGVDHEFSTINYIKEDVVDILLNLKQVRFALHTDEEMELTMLISGKKKITAADFEKQTDVEIVNPDMPIATLTDSAAKFELTVIVNSGRGYVPVEAREHEQLEVGFMAIDAVYTPVRTVNYKIEHVRVEQMTNYDKLMMEIETDGSITPTEAFTQACQILVDHFSLLGNAVAGQSASASGEEEAAEEDGTETVQEEEAAEENE